MASSSVTSSSSVASSSASDSSAVTSQWLNDLNALRAKERTPLTSDMVSDKNGVGSDEGKSLAALTQDAELTKWAQTRAEELAAQGSISHTNMKNGAPTWAVNGDQVDGGLFASPDYVMGSYINGPEALASWSGSTQNPISMWASELQDGAQGYGHYLTEVSPLANKVGFGYAKTATARQSPLWKLVTINSSKRAGVWYLGRWPFWFEIRLQLIRTRNRETSRNYE